MKIGGSRPGGRSGGPANRVSNLNNTRRSPASQRVQLDFLQSLNRNLLESDGANAGVEGIIESYELAFRMQRTAPEVMDMAGETEATLAAYGVDQKETANFGKQCILARRFAEAGVRYIQVSTGNVWDQHGNLPRDIKSQCGDIDQACYGLIQDLKQRGMLEETLVICGGEFGRTAYSQGALTETNYGRDHHPRAFSLWLAGAGIKGGTVYGDTDKYSFNITTPDKAVHVRDLHATILERCGLDHHKLAYSYQGLEQRLTGVEPAKVVRDILS
jgi:uncharacterized protein (DUF1501 family)